MQNLITVNKQYNHIYKVLKYSEAKRHNSTKNTKESYKNRRTQYDKLQNDNNYQYIINYTLYIKAVI